MVAHEPAHALQEDNLLPWAAQLCEARLAAILTARRESEFMADAAAIGFIGPSAIVELDRVLADGPHYRSPPVKGRAHRRSRKPVAQRAVPHRCADMKHRTRVRAPTLEAARGRVIPRMGVPSTWEGPTKPFALNPVTK